MRQFEFAENINIEEFDGFARDNSGKVKTHFLGSYEWGEVSKIRSWQPLHVGVRENGRLVATALVLKKALVAGYTYFYIPRGFTMDWEDLELLEYFTGAIKALGKKHKALFFKIDPDIRLHRVDVEGNVTGDAPDGIADGALSERNNNEDLVRFLEGLGYKRKPLNYAFENEQPRFTFRIDITGTLEDIQARYSKTTLHEIRKSHESHVEAYIGTADDIPEFVRLTKMTEARQGYISHDMGFYAKFYDILHKYGMADIYLGRVDIKALTERAKADLAENEALRTKYAEGQSKKARGMVKEIDNRLAALHKKLAELEGRPQEQVIVCAYLTVKYLDKIWTLYGANDMDYSRYYPNYAVYEKMIEDANAEGLRVFDGFGTVGRPDAAGSAIGLYEFKKKWGGELTEFIGEFDYILNKPVFFAYSKLIPIYHNIQNKRIMKRQQASE
ncbi:MAG: peptidoglycan bridge formation glycyltransferase FemA/FemB family protein [Mogibacterium sp.]|nr:peptidoglycan bridge formation glycyltransferase FemA/FemB family protein [Mogibacterium sp.]MBR2541148.1 peptidoglycan bridge formation glycyltransferase FemA/FemB family protein [Mogibacterium sp.]